MVPNQQLIVGLVIKYARRETLSEEEMHILETWWNESEKNRLMTEVFRDAERLREELRKDPARSARIWSNISQLIDEANVGKPKKERGLRVRLLWIGGSVAALILACVVGIHIFRSQSDRDIPKALVSVGYVPARATNNRMASLMLNDGRRVDLDTFPVGAIVEKNGNAVLRKITTDIVRCDGSPDSNFLIAGLTVGIAHRPYTVRMPEGSLASILGGIQFSLNFNRQTRNVHLKGEGKMLCEIAKDAHRPFLLDAPNATSVGVLGTSFQVAVSATKPETKITLLNGKVRVSSDKGSVQLKKPFQEAVVSKGRPQLLEPADTAGLGRWSEDALMFHFKDIRLNEALQQVAGWYGCQIIYKDMVPGKMLRGKMRKTASLDDIVREIRVAQRQYADVQKQANTIVVSKWSNK